jgi:hypothetical protein
LSLERVFENLRSGEFRRKMAKLATDYTEKSRKIRVFRVQKVLLTIELQTQAVTGRR